MRVRTRIAAGSGVIIDPAGLVLTSAHLVGDSLSAQVLVDDTRTVIGTVIHLDELRDLALLQLPHGKYRSARLGRSSDVVLGAWVSAIGYPLNLAGPATITTGVVPVFSMSRSLDERCCRPMRPYTSAVAAPSSARTRGDRDNRVGARRVQILPDEWDQLRRLC